MSFEKQTKIAQYISLGVGIVSILVAIVLANGEIKSAYEWFNSFMGLVLGVLAGITSWAYAIISISTSLVVGYITSSIELAITGKKIKTLESATVFCDRKTDEILRGNIEGA